MSKISSAKKVVFLFGAGASVPANCKTAIDITKWLIQAIEKSSYLNTQHKWIQSLWESIQLFSRDFHDTDTTTLPNGRVLNHKRFIPNFEHLIYLIELLEDYTDTQVRIPSNQRFYDPFKAIGFLDDLEAYSAFSFILTRLSSDIRAIDPLFQIVNIKGASGKYMWANKALLSLISDQFPKKYNLSFLAPFHNIFKDLTLKIVIATINYDLVFYQFFNDNLINFQDGFSKNSDPSIWESFDCETENVLYLKLHGSLNWFQIKENWFSEQSSAQSPNEIYKVNSLNILPLLKKKYREKHLKAEKYLYEFNIPHLIMGGLKDTKILDIPFVEIHREWQKVLSTADTVAIIGMSASDKHLLNQMRGLLLTNKKLDKIIIINPDKSVHLAFQAFFQNISRRSDCPFIFHYESKWDIDSIKNDLKLPFEEFVKMPSSQLRKHLGSL